ncbi:MAG TPA: dihydrolipoyl dehydrogenase [Roseiarcus sp.]|nr:dihydrolipoyl dehydrogenase [Roseiarcus sp.]
MNELSCKVLIVGGGPGGYVCAIRAGQLGLDAILVDGEQLGGTCLSVGCIPSKALIHAAETLHAQCDAAALGAMGMAAAPRLVDFARTIAWKDGIVSRLTTGVGALLKKAGVRSLRGRAILLDGKTAIVAADTGENRIRCEHLVIATGSQPAALPALPFGGDVISSTQALALPVLPKTLAVIGAGYIGLELGTAFAKLGVEVTVIEALDRVLPLYDAELTAPVARRLAELGVKVHLNARAGFAQGALRLTQTDGGESKLQADKVLVAVGRRPRTQGFGLEGLDLVMSGAFLRVDERCATSMRNVWAIGDVTGEPMLAHRASAQGEMVAEIIDGKKRAFDKIAIAAVTFTDPEVVSVGLAPEAARRRGEISVGMFPWRASGRALTLQRDDGFVRIVARADNHVVLGLQAVGAGVSELSAAFALALEMGARLEDIAATVHAHPTLSEAINEAARAGLGHALHL